MKQTPTTRITLNNGMTILNRTNHATPTVSISFSFAGGAASDPADKTGLANFALSLAVKGTRERSAAEIADAIDGLGMELGFSAGRHTSGVSARVLSEKARPALALITEILKSAHPGEDEMEKMRQRILTGIRMRMDDPSYVAGRNLSRMIYGESHPYGSSVSGELDTVQRITLDDVYDYYTRTFQAGACLGVIVGNIEADTLQDIAADTLGKVKPGGKFELTPPDKPSLPTEPKSISVPMPGKTQSDVALGFIGIDRRDPDYYALQLGNTVLGRLSLGGRVGQRVRDTEGMAYYAYTTFDAGVGAGTYMFRAGVNPKNVDRAVELALEEMQKARSEGLTSEEIDVAKVYLTGAMNRSVETNAGIASILFQQEIFGLGDDYYLRYGDILAGITLEEINAALARHLHPGHHCLSVAGPLE